MKRVLLICPGVSGSRAVKAAVYGTANRAPLVVILPDLRKTIGRLMQDAFCRMQHNRQIKMVASKVT